MTVVLRWGMVKESRSSFTGPPTRTWARGARERGRGMVGKGVHVWVDVGGAGNRGVGGAAAFPFFCPY